MTKRDERIKHILKYMEYDELSDAQHNLIIKFEERFQRRTLTESELEVLEDIFQQAAEKVEWSRG